MTVTNHWSAAAELTAVFSFEPELSFEPERGDPLPRPRQRRTVADGQNLSLDLPRPTAPALTRRFDRFYEFEDQLRNITEAFDDDSRRVFNCNLNKLLCQLIKGQIREGDELEVLRTLIADLQAGFAVLGALPRHAHGRSTSPKTEPATLPLPLPPVAVRVPKKGNTLSRVRRRLIEPIEDESGSLAYQHTVFCQTGLPYRNPGDDLRTWHREQGTVSLRVEAGAAKHPKTGKWVELGLPWGTKPRLILAHLNAEALRQKSPVIEVESSLSAFVKRIRGFDGGREIRLFKDQLSRLSVALVRLAMTQGDRALQINTQVVTAFELWPELDERQRVLWPSTIRLSADYFNSLQEHAVPLWEEDLKALAHSAMALDIYAWLAQRLHRIKPNKPAFITWARLQEQFGPDYGRMRDFKRAFRIALGQVLARYRVALIDIDDHGMTLHNSPPPVGARNGVTMLR